MAEVTRRRTGELLRALFQLLMGAPDGLQAREALRQLAAQVTLTPYEADEYESGGRRFDKIVRFATVDCVKAGWMVKEKGVWTITEEGRRAHAELPDPEAFYKRACKLYAEWRAAQPDADMPQTETNESNAKASGHPSAEDADLETTNKTARITFEEAEEQAWKEISHLLRNMPPYDFQELVADLLRAMGYHVHWVSPPGKDGGIDILAGLDPLGTQSPRIKVQVKRQQQAVAVDGLRSFSSLIRAGDVGLFVCIGGFTRDAEAEARTQTDRPVKLLNLEALFDLWVEHYDKLSDPARRRLPLKPIHFIAPEG